MAEMNDIDRIIIKPLTSGYLVDVNYSVDKETEEHAYSDFEDLLNALTLMLGPSPTVIGMDLADPSSDTAVEHVSRLDGTSSTTWTKRDGSSETLEDDGWREWDGQLNGRDYPPGITGDTTVEVRFRNAPGYSSRASGLVWFHHAGSTTDIVAYRVVRP